MLARLRRSDRRMSTRVFYRDGSSSDPQSSSESSRGPSSVQGFTGQRYHSAAHWENLGPFSESSFLNKPSPLFCLPTWSASWVGSCTQRRWGGSLVRRDPSSSGGRVPPQGSTVDNCAEASLFKYSGPGLVSSGDSSSSLYPPRVSVPRCLRQTGSPSCTSVLTTRCAGPEGHDAIALRSPCNTQRCNDPSTR